MIKKGGRQRHKIQSDKKGRKTKRHTDKDKEVVEMEKAIYSERKRVDR